MLITTFPRCIHLTFLSSTTSSLTVYAILFLISENKNNFIVRHQMLEQYMDIIIL